ncbi:hypothetical protein FWD20_00720 [Candidatus Saccharibacteria bacterium]|nr:hypothetical protein [Candidatus Saccharibacteria bacterium]
MAADEEGRPGETSDVRAARLAVESSLGALVNQLYASHNGIVITVSKEALWTLVLEEATRKLDSLPEGRK